MTATDPARPARRPMTRAAARRAAQLYALATCGLLVVGLLLTRVMADGRLERWDERVSRVLAAHRVAPLDTVTQVATRLANTEGIVAVALVVVLVLLRRGRRADAAIVVVALVFELAVFLSTTFVVDRPRPDVARLNRTPSTDSFPSGHTAATFALYGAIALLATRRPAPRARRIGAWSAVVVLDALVGFARVYRGMHHVTDVLAGAALGAVALVSAVLVVDAALGRGARTARPGPAVSHARAGAPARSAAPARPDETYETDRDRVPERVTAQERTR